MSSPTTLTLIRHGESRAQRSAVCSGHDTCEGLTDHGRAQASALRDRLAASEELAGVAHVYTSILERARETARIIAPSLPPRAKVEAECDWCEIHPGEAEGMTWEEIDRRYPLKAARYDPFMSRLPGGESWAQFYVRAGARLRRVAAEHEGQHVAVVCHGGIVGASFVALGEVPVQRGWPFVVRAQNTSITQWCFELGEWWLIRFNDAAHLAALAG